MRLHLEPVLLLTLQFVNHDDCLLLLAIATLQIVNVCFTPPDHDPAGRR